MIRKAIIVVLTLAAAGTSALWIMSDLNWPCDWTYDGYVGRYRYRVGHSCSLPEPPTWLPSWFLLLLHNSDFVSELRLSQGSVSIEGWHHETPRWTPPPPNKRIRLIGFGFDRSRWAQWTGRWEGFANGVSYKVRVPLWAPLALFATYPTVAFIRGPARRWRRRRKGLCLKCGYNLTGNVSGICPECGTRIEQP